MVILNSQNGTIMKKALSQMATMPAKKAVFATHQVASTFHSTKAW